MQSVAGDGRGDWTLDLKKGYAISKINSREILIIHKDNLSDPGGEIVVPKFFVKAYNLQEQYICVEGISIENMAATEQELVSTQSSYCIINTDSGMVIGPLVYESFKNECDSLKIKSDCEWEIV